MDSLKKLINAACAIYDAGHWTCDRDVDEQKLWEDLRDALGKTPGMAPKPLPTGKLVDAVASDGCQCNCSSSGHPEQCECGAPNKWTCDCKWRWSND